MFLFQVEGRYTENQTTPPFFNPFSKVEKFAGQLGPCGELTKERSKSKEAKVYQVPFYSSTPKIN
jgi:hypothetical protein